MVLLSFFNVNLNKTSLWDGVFYQEEIKVSLNKNPIPWGFSRHSPVYNGKTKKKMIRISIQRLKAGGGVLKIDYPTTKFEFMCNLEAKCLKCRVGLLPGGNP